MKIFLSISIIIVAVAIGLTYFAHKSKTYQASRAMAQTLLEGAAELEGVTLSEEQKKNLIGPEEQAAIKERLDLIKRDSATVESAPWFGKTGIGTRTEQELPRYLRREFGQVYSDPGSIKAAELEYIGSFPEDSATIHYWRIPHQAEPTYAYVIDGPNGVIGWGDKQPPESK